jgi:hypothetical protein
MFLMACMSLPFAFFVILPSGAGSGDPMGEALRAAIVIGLNAFVWGYGMAALICGIQKWIALFRRIAAPNESA